VQHDAAVQRVGCLQRGERIAVGVAIVAEHARPIHVQGMIVGRDVEVGSADGRRGVDDGDLDRRRGAGLRGVVGSVGERGRPEEAGGRGVVERSVRIERQRADARAGGEHGGERTAGVVDEHALRRGDVQRVIVRAGVAVGTGCRQCLTADIDEDGCSGMTAAAVRDLV
jgi:hypothetical protein